MYYLMVNNDEIVTFIACHVREKGYPPTFREIGRGVGLSSSSTVQKRMDTLKSQGRVDWTPGRFGTLRLL